ncbi:MAG: hypothetical protein BTN85_1963 [Candidatus Methanohalarchaeum thermophilum]|uniref:Uncharacterized protein n=1 Tax=Methanohalarchaeum thermophilum TaxID=1903181 RepID=A0A1Q6DSJ0_METT1|nr:MAG: hypothetical protein BTN85_1963 [Candidatus Methanohalarchaeum thermophilum]
MRAWIIKKFLLNYLNIYLNRVKRERKHLFYFILSLILLIASIAISLLLLNIIPKITDIGTEEITSTIFPLITGLYILFILLPITGLSSKGEDPSLLLKYPITYTEAFLIESIRSISKLWLIAIYIPPILSILYILSNSFPIFILSSIGYLLFLFHAAGIGYIFFSLLQGFLEDRKFRDTIAIISGLLFLGFYLLIYLLPELIDIEKLLSLSYSIHLLLPSGWVVDLAAQKKIFWIAPITLITLITIFLGKHSFKYSYYISTEKTGGKKIKTSKDIRLPIDKAINAMLNKDLKYYKRDPGLKLGLLFSMIFPLIFGLQSIFTEEEITIFYLKYFGIFAGFFFSFSFYNFLGYERNGLIKLLSSPIKRKDIIYSKNLILGIFFIIYLITTLIALKLILKTPFSIKVITISISTLLITFAATNNTGVRYPEKMPEELRGGRNSSLKGVIFTMILSFILLTPIVIHMTASTNLIQTKIPIPLIFIYSILIYLTLTKKAEKTLKNNEIKIIEKFNREN